MNAPRLNHSKRGRYPTYLPLRDWRLTWPGWLVTHSSSYHMSVKVSKWCQLSIFFHRLATLEGWRLDGYVLCLANELVNSRNGW